MPPNFYSMNEKKQIFKYIISENGYNEVKGRMFWMKFSKKGILNRTWQSLKEIFLKHLINDLDNPYYDLTSEQKNHFRKGYKAGNPNSIINRTSAKNEKSSWKIKPNIRNNNSSSESEFDSPPMSSTQQEKTSQKPKPQSMKNVEVKASSTESQDEDNDNNVSRVKNNSRDKNMVELDLTSPEVVNDVTEISSSDGSMKQEKNIKHHQSMDCKRFNSSLFGFASGGTIVRRSNQSLPKSKVKLKLDNMRNKRIIGNIVVDSDSNDGGIFDDDRRGYPNEPIIGLHKGKLYELKCGNNKYHRQSYHQFDIHLDQQNNSVTAVQQSDNAMNREINKIFGVNPESSTLYWKLKYFFEKDRCDEVYRKLLDRQIPSKSDDICSCSDDLDLLPVKDAETSSKSYGETSNANRNIEVGKKDVEKINEIGNSKLQVERCVGSEVDVKKNENFCKISISKQGEQVIDQTIVLDSQNTDILVNLIKNKIMIDSNVPNNSNDRVKETVEEKEKEIFDIIASDKGTTEPVKDRRIFSTLEIEMMTKDIFGESSKQTMENKNEESNKQDENRNERDVKVKTMRKSASFKSQATPKMSTETLNRSFPNNKPKSRNRELENLNIDFRENIFTDVSNIKRRKSIISVESSNEEKPQKRRLKRYASTSGTSSSDSSQRKKRKDDTNTYSEKSSSSKSSMSLRTKKSKNYLNEFDRMLKPEDNISISSDSSTDYLYSLAHLS